MKKWKYLKGCEADFADHDTACLVVKSGSTGEIFYLSIDYAGRIEVIEGRGDVVIAYREPITGEQDLNDCIGEQEVDVVEHLITERGSRYGKFKDGAEIMQELKDVMREVDGWRNLTPSQREALDMIQHNQVSIVSGGTGCGKSTQVPQFLMEAFRESDQKDLNIVVCEPRRVSCLGLYLRVIEEQGFVAGNQCPVGYQVQGDVKCE